MKKIYKQATIEFVEMGKMNVLLIVSNDHMFVDEYGEFLLD